MPDVYVESTKREEEGYCKLVLGSYTYYYLDGKLHRLDGPAWIENDPDIGVVESYWIYGNQVIGKDLDELLEILKCPLEKLPLHINAKENIRPAVMHRLKEENRTIK